MLRQYLQFAGKCNSHNFFLIFRIRTDVSSEFHFKTNWNNKAPPPALLEQFRSQHNSINNVAAEEETEILNKHQLLIPDDRNKLRFLFPPASSDHPASNNRDLMPEIIADAGPDSGDRFQNNQRISHNIQHAPPAADEILQTNDNLDDISVGNNIFNNQVDNINNIVENKQTTLISTDNVEEDLFVYNDDGLVSSAGNNGDIIDISGDKSYGLAHDDSIENYDPQSARPAAGVSGVKSDGAHNVGNTDVNRLAELVQYHRVTPTSQQSDLIQSNQPASDGNDFINNGFTVPVVNVGTNYDADAYTRSNNFQNQNIFGNQPETESLPGNHVIAGKNTQPGYLTSYSNSALPTEENNPHFSLSSSSVVNSNNYPPPTSQFKPPETLVYGFVPITSSSNEKLTFPSQGSGVSFSGPNLISQNVRKPKYKPSQNQRKPSYKASSTSSNQNKQKKKPSYKPSYKPSASQSRAPKHIVLDVISKLLAPFTNTLNTILKHG